MCVCADELFQRNRFDVLRNMEDSAKPKGRSSVMLGVNNQSSMQDQRNAVTAPHPGSGAIPDMSLVVLDM